MTTAEKWRSKESESSNLKGHRLGIHIFLFGWICIVSGTV